MGRPVLLLLILVVTFSRHVSAQISPVVIPAGTVLQIRLRQTVSSFGNRRNTPVAAIVIAPVEAAGRVVLPLNSEVRGTLRNVRRVGLGLARETAFVDLTFDSIALPNGLHANSS
jgi:hypothetical protein